MHWTVWTGRAVGKAVFAFVRFLLQLGVKPAVSTVVPYAHIHIYAYNARAEKPSSARSICLGGHASAT